MLKHRSSCIEILRPSLSSLTCALTTGSATTTRRHSRPRPKRARRSAGSTGGSALSRRCRPRTFGGWLAIGTTAWPRQCDHRLPRSRRDLPPLAHRPRARQGLHRRLTTFHGPDWRVPHNDSTPLPTRRSSLSRDCSSRPTGGRSHTNQPGGASSFTNCAAPSPRTSTGTRTHDAASATPSPTGTSTSTPRTTRLASAPPLLDQRGTRADVDDGAIGSIPRSNPDRKRSEMTASTTHLGCRDVSTPPSARESAP